MISEELKRIKEAKDALKVSINNKGVTVTDADSISVYASKVDLIVTGSTIEMQSIDITENGKYENTSIPYSSVTVNVDDGGARIKELEDEIVDLNSQITEKQNKIDELQNKLDYDEGLINDLRTEITTLETQKLALENELNELKSKVNSMTDLTVSENGTYTPSFGYKKVTVNVPSDRKEEQSVTITNNGEYTYTETVVTGITVNVDTEKHTVTSKTITENGEYNSSGNEVWNKVTVNVPQGVLNMQEITVTDLGIYINSDVPYSSVTVSDEYFYKKYVDEKGNVFIINENGEKIITVSGSTPTPTDEYYHLTIYIPNNNEYSAISSSYLLKSEVSEAYFDDEEYDTTTVNGEECFNLNKKEIQKDTYHTIKLKLVNPDVIKSQYSNFTLYHTKGASTFHLDGELILPEGLITLKKYFYNGYGLTKLVLPTTLRTIEKNAVESFSKLTEIVIPNSVTSIGNSAFQQCSGLTSVTIPNSVTSIGQSAFYACSNLTSIDYKGTNVQFTAITKDYGWKSSVPTSCIVHCTDGDYPITDFN